MPLEGEPTDDNVDDAIDTDDTYICEYEHLFSLSMNVLNLSQPCYDDLQATGVTSVGDCIDVSYRGVWLAPSLFKHVSEVKDKLIEQGYGHYLQK